jgi:small subunit ribosomal protein S3
MGRKVHPIGYRLKINRDWDARWYAEGERYVDLLNEDRAIRNYLKSEAGRAGISRVEIERFPNQVQVNIHTARPGIVIGRKGEAVKKLKTDLENMTSKTVRIEVTEIDKPDMDAQLVAENIAGQLTRRIGHSRAMKRAVTQAIRQGAQGIRINVGVVWAARIWRVVNG